MSTLKKVILLFLVCTSIILGSILLFPYLKLTNIPLFNNLPKTSTISPETKAKYGTVDTNQLINYAEKTIKIPYRPNRSYLTTFKYGARSRNGSFVEYSTNPWTINNTSTYVLLTQSPNEGTTSSQNVRLFDFTITVERANEKHVSLEELLKTATIYFQIPQNIDMMQHKRFETAFGANALEITWKDTFLNTVESLSVWSYKDENSGNKAYFVTCRIFQDSPLYKNNSCYYNKDQR